MSLLTSPDTTQQQLRFFHKMEKLYHKRGASQYLSRQKKQFFPLTTNLATPAVHKIQLLIQTFMENINTIVKQFNELDHYCVLEVLRKNSFFSDVANSLNYDVNSKLNNLSKVVKEKEEYIKILKKQLKREQLLSGQQEDKANQKQKIKYNPMKSVSSNLYYHARNLSQQQFADFYNKISLSNQITLKKVQKNNPEGTGQNQITDLLQSLIELGKKQNIEEKVSEMTKTVEQMLDKKRCRKPCCIEKDENENVSRAKQIMRKTTHTPQTREVYKTDKSSEYFRRYYRGESFNLNDITSVSHTKMQEMERLEKEYRRNLKQRAKKQLYAHRYSRSSVRD